MHARSPRLLRVHHGPLASAPTARMPWKTIRARRASARSRHASCRPASALFGLPEGVDAEIKRERDGKGANDSFAIRLRYPGLTSWSRPTPSPPSSVPATCRGTRELRQDRRRPAGSGAQQNHPHRRWPMGHEPPPPGDTLRRCRRRHGDSPIQPFPATIASSTGRRDAILGKASPVAAVDAWRVARLLEYAAESSEKRCEIVCDWSDEPFDRII